MKMNLKCLIKEKKSFLCRCLDIPGIQKFCQIEGDLIAVPPSMENFRPQQSSVQSQSAPPPQHQASKPTTPSLSPISVVRNKRANQANWEKHQSRKNSVAGSESGLGGVVAGLDNCVSQGKVYNNISDGSTLQLRLFNQTQNVVSSSTRLRDFRPWRCQIFLKTDVR